MADHQTNNGRLPRINLAQAITVYQGEGEREGEGEGGECYSTQAIKGQRNHCLGQSICSMLFDDEKWFKILSALSDN